MKEKYIIILLLVAVLFCFTGCQKEDQNIPRVESITKKYNTKLDNLKVLSDDSLFWNSAERAANMIGDTLEPNYEVEIDYRLQIGDNTVVIEGFGAKMIGEDEAYRELSVAEILYNLSHNETVVEAHNNQQSVEVTGIIIRWQAKRHWYKQELMDFSACELDSEGGWDFASTGRMVFFGMPHVISVEYEIAGVDTSLLFSVRDEKTLSELRKCALH